MNVKWKIILKSPILLWRNHRARVLARKIKRYQNENRYPDQWKIRYVIKKIKKFFKVTKIKIIVKGYENVPKKKPVFLTPNHCSFFDAPALIAALENASPVPGEFQIEPIFLAKKELKKNTFKGYLDILSTFYIDRENPREALKTLQEYTLFVKHNKKAGIVFPEGTRSKDGFVGEFKTGIFKMVKDHFIPIVPVTINNSIYATNFKRKKVLEIEVIFSKMIKPADLLNKDTKTIAEQVREIVKSNLKNPV